MSLVCRGWPSDDVCALFNLCGGLLLEGVPILVWWTFPTESLFFSLFSKFHELFPDFCLAYVELYSFFFPRAFQLIHFFLR